MAGDTTEMTRPCTTCQWRLWAMMDHAGWRWWCAALKRTTPEDGRKDGGVCGPEAKLWEQAA